MCNPAALLKPQCCFFVTRSIMGMFSFLGCNQWCNHGKYDLKVLSVHRKWSSDCHSKYKRRSVYHQNTKVNFFLKPCDTFKADVKLKWLFVSKCQLKNTIFHKLSTATQESVGFMFWIGFTRLNKGDFTVDETNEFKLLCLLMCMMWAVVWLNFPWDGDCDWHRSVLEWPREKKKDVCFEVTIYYVEGMRQDYTHNRACVQLTCVHKTYINHLFDQFYHFVWKSSPFTWKGMWMTR